MFCYQDLFDTYAFIVLSVRAPFLGESSGIIGIPEETMEVLVPILETIASEEENLALEEDGVPTVEAEEDVVPKESLSLEVDLGPEKNIAFEVESLVHEESVAPEVVMGASIVDSRAPVFAAIMVSYWCQLPTFPWSGLAFTLACHYTR